MSDYVVDDEPVKAAGLNARKHSAPLPGYLSKPKCRQMEYATYEARLETFHDWPSHSPMNPQDLARAGFYYSHYSDKVKCPYCYGGVYNWDPQDNAFTEHVRHNPTCEFIKFKTLEYQHILNTPMSIAIKPMQKFEESTSVKAVQFLGYPLDVIRRVTSPKEVQANISPGTILDRIFDLEKKQGQSMAGESATGDESDSNMECGHMNEVDMLGPLKPNSSSNNTELGASQAKVDMPDGVEEGANNGELSFQSSVTYQRTLNPEYERLKSEHRKLQNSSICSKCRNKAVDCLFLPCRHLVACEGCSESIEKCLQCNQEIIGTVKVFMT